MDVVDAVSFGTLLRRYRLAAGLTQEELAERAHLSARGISDLERGARSTPRRDTLLLLVDALELPADERARLEGAAQAARVLALAPDTLWGESRSGAYASPRTETPLPIGGFLGSLPSEQIVARGEELTAITSALDTVLEGTGQLVLLAGQRGAGKTRLGQEATFMAHRQGFLVATGRCYEPESTVPFVPFLEALEMVYAAVPANLRLQMPRRWPRLAPLLPEQPAATTPEPSADPKEAQQRIIRAAADFLIAAAEERPLALLVDDLQWADEPSLRLLTHLARETRGQRVFILATYCDTELQRDQPLDRALRELTRERLADRVVVRRLTPEGTAAMVAATVGDMEMSEEFLEFVHRRTKGVPYLIKEILHSLGGHYRLIREIGSGGMGRVFQAVDTRTGGQVAAKIMFASREAETTAAVRFEQEGAVLASLQHRNIVRVHGTFTEEHASCIVMELLRGESLADVLRSQPPDLARTKHIMRQVASALVCAHGKGIVHRDIKPDNIMIQAGDLVKVTDFGIARILRPSPTLQTITSTGMTLGTPLYMSPEQIEGRKISGRADIYAVGAVLYQMVTGHPPFEGEDALTIAFKHVREEPRPPREARPGLPADWDALILKALAKDPADRFQTAAALEASIGLLSTHDGRKADAWTPPPRSDQGRAEQVVRSPPLLIPAAAKERGSGGLRAGLWAGVARMAGSRRAAMGIVAFLAIASVGAWLLHRSTPSGSRPQHRPVAIFQQHTAGRFDAPNGVAIDGLGNIYVADQVTDHVQKLSASGEPLAQWGSRGSGPAQLNGPWGVAVDRRGTIVYVADTANNRVQKFTANGQYLGQLGLAGSGRGQFSSPYGIALDVKGNVYVADEGNRRVQELSPTGAFIRQWNHRLQFPEGVTVDNNGNVYVADPGAGRVYRLSPGGKSFPYRGSGPAGVAVDSTSKVYITDQVEGTIRKIAPNGTVLAVLGVKGSKPGQFQSPQGIAIDPAGNLVVADNATHQVQRLSPSGRPLARWYTTGAALGLFSAPAGLAVDGHGAIYVVDSSRNGGLAYKLNAYGQPDPRWRRTGAASSPYSYGGMAVDVRGTVYVTDQVNSVILKLSTTGRRIGVLGGSSSLSSPTAVAVDRTGNVYVADTGNDRIVKFGRDGRLLHQWGQPGAGPLQFSAPSAIALDSSGHIYVVDRRNDVVQKLLPNGSYVMRWGSAGSKAGEFKSPNAVAVDARGNVYVADYGNDRVQEFTSNGTFLVAWGTRGSAPGQFRGPSGVAFDSKGDVYVADTDNHRIQKFAPGG